MGCRSPRIYTKSNPRAAIEFLGNDSSKLEVILSQMVQLLKGGNLIKWVKELVMLF